MKIGIMAAWNTTSGVAMHAEPVGKALRKKNEKENRVKYDMKSYNLLTIFILTLK